MKTIVIREGSSAYLTALAPTIETVIHNVQETNEPVILIQDDKPIVAVIPIKDYERFNRWREQEITTRQVANEGFERERAAFNRLKPELLKTHNGLYVAIHDERVMDTDSNDRELAKRTYAKNLFPVYIGLVSVEPQVVEIDSPEEVWDVSL